MGKAKVDLTEKAGLPFRLDLVNCDYHDLPGLLEGLKRKPAARMLFSGVPGSGKSELAKHIAAQLGIPIQIQRFSDIGSPWVSQTEINIASMFKSAAQEKSLLVLDECDVLLSKRTGAIHRWEVTQTAEVLTQLEDFAGICVFTTNLKTNLDEAVLRRFDLKVEFSQLKSLQAQEMLETTCAHLGLQYEDHYVLPSRLTLGDFAVVVRQNRFNPVKDIGDLVGRLEAELRHREPKKGIGFLAVAA
jgi:SpoVK/Ycf46/Vps4 family AAA+-type ATPase